MPFWELGQYKFRDHATENWNLEREFRPYELKKKKASRKKAPYLSKYSLLPVICLNYFHSQTEAFQRCPMASGKAQGIPRVLSSKTCHGSSSLSHKWEESSQKFFFF